MSTPAENTRTRLIAAGLVTGNLTAGSAWIGLVGGLTDAITAPQVAIIDTGGIFPYDSHNSTPPARPGLQILVRGLPNAWADAAAKARAVWASLRASAPTGVMLASPTTSPIDLGRDDQNRPTWSMNFQLIVKE